MDDLIDELAEAVPPVQQDQIPSMTEVITYTDIILYGSDEARERLERDPGFARYCARLSRLSQATPTPDVDSLDTSPPEEGSEPPHIGD